VRILLLSCRFSSIQVAGTFCFRINRCLTFKIEYFVLVQLKG